MTTPTYPKNLWKKKLGQILFKNKSKRPAGRSNSTSRSVPNSLEIWLTSTVSIRYCTFLCIMWNLFTQPHVPIDIGSYIHIQYYYIYSFTILYPLHTVQKVPFIQTKTKQVPFEFMFFHFAWDYLWWTSKPILQRLECKHQRPTSFHQCVSSPWKSWRRAGNKFLVVNICINFCH